MYVVFLVMKIYFFFNTMKFNFLKESGIVCSIIRSDCKDLNQNNILILILYYILY